MIILNGEELDMTIEDNRRILGKHYENVLYNLLISKGYDYRLAKNEFCCYDMFNYDKRNGIKNFLELKTRTKPISELNVEYVDVEKVKKYKLIQDITFSSDICNFYYIFNHLSTLNENNNEYYYFKIDFSTIDKYFVNNICNKKTYEIPIRDVRPLKELFDRLD